MVSFRDEKHPKSGDSLWELTLTGCIECLRCRSHTEIGETCSRATVGVDKRPWVKECGRAGRPDGGS